MYSRYSFLYALADHRANIAVGTEAMDLGRFDQTMVTEYCTAQREFTFNAEFRKAAAVFGFGDKQFQKFVGNDVWTKYTEGLITLREALTSGLDKWSQRLENPAIQWRD